MLFALVDTGAQENFLSQKIVLEEGLQATPTRMSAETVDGHRISIYGEHTITTSAEDARGMARSCEHTYLATDISKYDAILGYPWLERV